MAEALELLCQRRAVLAKKRQQILEQLNIKANISVPEQTLEQRVTVEENWNIDPASCSPSTLKENHDLVSQNCNLNVSTENLDFPSDDSIADPDYTPSDIEDPENLMPSLMLPSLLDSSLQLEEEDIEWFPERELEQNDVQEHRQRKRKAEQGSWKRNVNKKKRETGKEYKGFRRSETNKYVQDVIKPARKLAATCTSKRCLMSKVFACSTITEDMRKIIFEEFWNLSWMQKQIYVRMLVDVQNTKRKTKSNHNSRRTETKIYHLKVDDKKERVCLKMFLNTLGLKEWTIRYWLGERTQQKNQDRQPEMLQNINSTSKGNSVIDFLKKLPKLPSHYCRKSSNKLYLEPVIQSKAQLYRLYLEHVICENVPAASRKLFNDVLSRENISLFKPKKDECDTCCAYRAGNLHEEVYQRHISLKDEARNEKNKDKEAAKQGQIHTITADLQAVKLCPYLNASALYFKTKLCVHNFTVYNIGNEQVKCYWFDETVTDLKATTYATFFYNYVSSLIEDDPKDVVIFTDGCTSQNRNCVVANALLRLAVNKKVTITQKFLEKGHTQMEADSVHSCIEIKLKNREIFLPSQYASITKEARSKPFPYDVISPDYTYFKDYSLKDYMVYESIRPGRSAGDSCVTDIRVLRYNKDGTIDFKLLYSDDFTTLPRRPKNIDTLRNDVPQLHNAPLKISKVKFDHLQELKNLVIPKDHHFFYDLLQYH